MAKDALSEIIERARGWPPELRERAAHLLIALENPDTDDDWQFGDESAPSPAAGG